MASPFPGMDPYLEASHIWQGFHHHLAEDLVGRLNARIGPKYFADVNVRTVYEDVSIASSYEIRPDVSILKETALPPAYAVATAEGIPPAPVRRIAAVADQIKLRTVHVRLTEGGQLVTSIEILSPYNKRPGKGLDEYCRKRAGLLLSCVHLVEIDLLRRGERPGREVNDPPLDTDYVFVVSRSRGMDTARISEIWPVALSEPLPVLPIPLLEPDPDVALPMNDAICSIYSRAGYDWRINYKDPVPPPELRPAMAEWLREHLPEMGVKAAI